MCLSVGSSAARFKAVLLMLARQNVRTVMAWGLGLNVWSQTNVVAFTTQVWLLDEQD